MEYLRIILTALFSIVELFILTKIMGKRQISQLNMFDYIIGITIGSIAAEMSTIEENDFWKPATAMAVYAVVTLIISLLNSKSVTVRRFINGRSQILMSNNQIHEKNLKKAHLDINEFLTQCRMNGYFNLDNIETAIMEENGRITFLPKSSQRPVTPEDMKIVTQKEQPFVSLIIDGKLLKENLKLINKDEKWLKSQLKTNNAENIDDVFYAAWDNNTFFVSERNNRRDKEDIFQ